MDKANKNEFEYEILSGDFLNLNLIFHLKLY